MNCWRTAAVADFRSARKCFSMSASLCLTLVMLLLATQAHCRPSDEEGFAGGDEYADVDNVEWHHVKVVDGVMREDHPVIMYKEDFVSEDYDPTKNRTISAATNTTDSGAAAPRPQRKYKDIAHRRRRLNRTDTEQYRALKPEKMYFDVLPQAPLVVADDSGADNSKFDSSKIRVDVISLIDNDNNDQVDAQLADGESSKQLLSKRPKKFHSRTRRDTQTDGVHVVRKRNPYIRHHQPEVNSVNFFDNFVESIRRQTPSRSAFVKHNVAGNRWNDPYSPVYIPVAVPDAGAGAAPNVPISFPSRVGGIDTPTPRPPGLVWGSRPQAATRPPNNVQRTTPSLFHDANPDNADFSFLNPRTTSRPATNNRRTTPSLFHDANPEYADFSFMTPQSQAPRDTSGSASAIDRRQWATRPQSSAFSGRTVPAQSPPRIQQYGPQCAQATDSCCGYQVDEVRYNCFQMVGCERTLSEIIDFCDN